MKMGLATLCLLAWGNSLLAASVTLQVNDAKDEGGVEYAVVSLHPTQGTAPLPTNPSVQIMDQIDKEFVPHVLPVVVGTPVSFPNKDQIKHHVYSIDEVKPFELKLYKGTPTQPIVFDKPGKVSLGCNIHDHMSGYIYVLDTPWFGISGPDGRLAINDIPAGEYELRLWQPRLKQPDSYTQTIVLGENDSYENEVAVKLRRAMRTKPLPADWFTDPY